MREKRQGLTINDAGTPSLKPDRKYAHRRKNGKERGRKKIRGPENYPSALQKRDSERATLLRIINMASAAFPRRTARCADQGLLACVCIRIEERGRYTLGQEVIERAAWSTYILIARIMLAARLFFNASCCSGDVLKMK